MVLLGSTGLGEQRVAGRLSRAHVRSRQPHGDHRSFELGAPESLFQETNQVLLMPGWLSKRHLNERRLNGLASTFMLEGDRGMRERQLLGREPPAQLHDESPRGKEDGFGMFDAIRQ